MPTPHNPFPNRRTCSGCAHYSAPGTWSSRCLLFQRDDSKSHEWNLAWGRVRADNTCDKWAAVAEQVAA